MRRVLLVLLGACGGEATTAPNVAIPAQPIVVAPAPVDAGAAVEVSKEEAVAEGPPAPAKRAIDEKFKVDGGGLLLGISKTEIWLYLNDGYTVVIDRSTGCATEGYPQADALTNIGADSFGDPEVLAAIRDMVGLGRRFGAGTHRFLSELTWSADGRHIFVAFGGNLFRSNDGGRSFAAVDDKDASRLAMSTDGKHLVYQRAGKYVSLPTDGSRGAKTLTSGQTFFLEMTADGRARFTRSEAEICLDTFELEKPARESSTCVKYPSQTTGVWPSREWEAVSPSGKYGVVKWEENRKGLTYVVSVVELATGKIVKTVTDMRAEVDDDGNMVMQTMTEGGGDHTYFQPRSGPRKLLGNDYLLAWRDKSAVLGVHRVAKLGNRKCDLVKLVATP